MNSKEAERRKEFGKNLAERIKKRQLISFFIKGLSKETKEENRVWKDPLPKGKFFRTDRIPISILAKDPDRRRLPKLLRIKAP